jgi:hypothetical protein
MVSPRELIIGRMLSPLTGFILYPPWVFKGYVLEFQINYCLFLLHFALKSKNRKVPE